MPIVPWQGQWLPQGGAVLTDAFFATPFQAAVNVTVTLDPGVLPLVGRSLTITASGSTVQLDPGRLSLVGQALPASAPTTVTLAPGTLPLAGQALTMTRTVIVTLAPGSLRLVGAQLAGFGGSPYIAVYRRRR